MPIPSRELRSASARQIPSSSGANTPDKPPSRVQVIIEKEQQKRSQRQGHSLNEGIAKKARIDAPQEADSIVVEVGACQGNLEDLEVKAKHALSVTEAIEDDAKLGNQLANSEGIESVVSRTNSATPDSRRTPETRPSLQVDTTGKISALSTMRLSSGTFSLDCLLPGGFDVGAFFESYERETKMEVQYLDFHISDAIDPHFMRISSTDQEGFRKLQRRIAKDRQLALDARPSLARFEVYVSDGNESMPLPVHNPNPTRAAAPSRPADGQTIRPGHVSAELVRLRLLLNPRGQLSYPCDGNHLWGRSVTNSSFFRYYSDRVKFTPKELLFTLKDSLPEPKKYLITKGNQGNQGCFELVQQEVLRQCEKAYQLTPSMTEFAVVVAAIEWVTVVD